MAYIRVILSALSRDVDGFGEFSEYVLYGIFLRQVTRSVRVSNDVSKSRIRKSFVLNLQN